MPIYEYKCLDCGARLERMQKVSDQPLVTCEVCGGKLEKQWSLSGFQFKGAGWYVTDYSSKLKDTSADKTGKGEKPDDAGKTEKSGKEEKAEKTDDAKKSSAPESTAKTETASNKPNESAASSKTDTVSKKE